jgi:phage tail protein X
VAHLSVVAIDELMGGPLSCRPILSLRPSVDDDRVRSMARRPCAKTRTECLEQILHAFRDIADRDDIHKAAERLAFVQQWIENEAARAATDPVFVESSVMNASMI